MFHVVRHFFPLVLLAGAVGAAHQSNAVAQEGTGSTAPPPVPTAPFTPAPPVAAPAPAPTAAFPAPAAEAPTPLPPARSPDPDALAAPADPALGPDGQRSVVAPGPGSGGSGSAEAASATADECHVTVPTYVPAIAPVASLGGPVGLLHASTAEVGPVRQVRLGLHGEYFGANDFLIQGDSNQRLAGGFVFGYTLRPDLELFGAILNSSNRNKRNRDPDDRDPELIKTFGDLVLGGKWILPLSPAATLGAELGLKFLSGVSDLALSPSSTSWWLGPLFTYDMRRSAGIPLRFHAGANFFADNSANLHKLKVPQVTRSTKEAAMFAYGIAPSRLRLALAVDAPLDTVFPQVPIDPFIEYHVAYVTADADQDFADFMTPNCRSSSATAMPCVDNRDLQWLTLGARANVFRGITIDLGIDIRVRSPGFPFGPPLAPWNVMFGVSYPLDLDSLTRTVVVTRTVEKKPPETQGPITGVVRSARGGAPIEGAIVAVKDRPRARVASDPDGTFETPPLPPGPTELAITAATFEPAKVTATVVAGKPVDVAVTLEPNPPSGKVHGRVTSAAGQGIEVVVRFAGAEIREAKSDTSGVYSASLPVGSYRVRVARVGLGAKEVEVDLLVGQDKQLDFVLRPVTANPNVVLSDEAIKLKRAIRFVGMTAKLDGPSEKLLDAVADLLDLHAEIKHVRIVGHWDSGLAKLAAVALTQQQAETVRAYLIQRGVAEGRLAVEGLGSAKPLVPNLTPMNRMRNRRIELLRLD